MLYTCHLTFLQWLLTMWKRHLSGAGVWFVHLCHRRTTVKEDILPHTFSSCQYIPPKSYTLELKVLFWGRLADCEDLLCAHLKVRWAGNIWASWEQENPSDVTSPARQKKINTSRLDFVSDPRSSDPYVTWRLTTASQWATHWDLSVILHFNQFGIKHWFSCFPINNHQSFKSIRPKKTCGLVNER